MIHEWPQLISANLAPGQTSRDTLLEHVPPNSNCNKLCLVGSFDAFQSQHHPTPLRNEY